MPLTPLQQAGSDLARSLGLRGEAEKQIYGMPEYQELLRRFYPTPIQAPTIDIDPTQKGRETELINNLLTQLSQRFATPAPTVDLGGFQSQLQNITNLLTQPAALGQLNPADLERLAVIKANEDAQLAQQQEDLRSQLVADLFGRGVQQSSIASQAGADFAREFGLVQSQAQAGQAAREMALRQFITQTQQGNLALAGQNVLGAGNLALGEFATESDAINQQINQMIQELSALTGIDLARQSASGELALGAQGLQEQRNQFHLGLQEQARQFNAQLKASQPSTLDRIIGIGASLAAAPFTGGTSLFGLAGQKLGSIFGGGIPRPNVGPMTPPFNPTFPSNPRIPGLNF